MSGEYRRLSAEQQLRVNAHIIGFFTTGDELFIDEMQAATKAIYDHGGVSGQEAFQQVLDTVRDELAANWSALPHLPNERSGLSAMQSQLREIRGLMGEEVERDLYNDAQRYSRLTDFFENNPSSMPVAPVNFPIGVLRNIQQQHGFISNDERTAETNEQYNTAIANGDYPTPSREALEAARRVRTQLPDDVEAVAIQIAANAFNMGGVEAGLITAFGGEHGRENTTPWQQEGRDETRMIVALDQVRDFLNDIDFPVSPDRNPHQAIDTSDTVTQLTNMGQQVARGSGRE